VLFAFSTMLSWSYYGMKATGYLFNDSARAELVFKIVFVVFTVIGAALTLGPVIDFSDSMIFLMSVPNVIGLYILAPCAAPRGDRLSGQARVRRDRQGDHRSEPVAGRPPAPRGHIRVTPGAGSCPTRRWAAGSGAPTRPPGRYG
jgi:hypothetical protein